VFKLTGNAKKEPDILLDGLRPGEKRYLGEWEIVKFIDEGGYGRAYRAQKTIGIGSMKVPVEAALKLINTRFANPTSAISSLINELNQLSKIKSRFVPKLLDAGVHNQGEDLFPYIVMDYIDGGSVRQEINMRRKEGKPGLPKRMFRTLADNVLRALKAANEDKENGLEFLHLDIKPENILYSKADEAFVLIDFGLATVANRTQTNGSWRGTRGYIAPEQFIDETSIAADIFALGVTFYEALTGVNPIEIAYQEHIAANGTPDGRGSRAQQIATETAVWNFDLLSSEQRTLVEPMLKLNPKERPPVDELIALSALLEYSPDSQVPETPKQDWAQVDLDVLAVLSNQSVRSQTVNVNKSTKFPIWFKTKIVDGRFALICSKPKDYLDLSRLGWKPYQMGTLIFEFESNPGQEQLAEKIVKSIRLGFRLTPPLTVS
jgi:serine/threonine protein kinase